jgi:hypothetical protein
MDPTGDLKNAMNIPVPQAACSSAWADPDPSMASMHFFLGILSLEQ